MEPGAITLANNRRVLKKLDHYRSWETGKQPGRNALRKGGDGGIKL